ncbi:saccharopine dehydrogenase NADP-binding domain-containing protein [Microbacterium betulae]|uniref:Saccharopine dehydrogenase NADP-binding domain-containing protein n=1 Tax=Microbacterium betulae TaxID=2981139 RepID=A0AA97FFE4_9MICO|nr:saccharopine dehydrogenase NADP-binding domain-containing protein [Microbacterium sp. AB]WOF21898.1 saccharopine dehydrogenase NADP-binding domain-containing protein [Microbacterium sp. AB]
MNQTREFDIVVFGATGFTGRLVAEHLLQKHGLGGEVAWAMGGQFEADLVEARDAIGAPEDTPFVIADAKDPVSLREMVARTKAVITTVGPYRLYGSDLVAACAESGTDYLDLSGESHWMRRMIDEHEARAKESGARILFACGFDSIPSDTGVWFCQDTARTALGAPVPRVKGRVRAFKGGVSGGSIASMKSTAEALEDDPSLAEVVNSPFGLTPGFEGPAQPSGAVPTTDPDVGAVVPFMLGVVDTQVVHRSNLLLEHAYGRGFVYDEMMVAGEEPGDEDGPGASPDADAPSPAAPKPGEGPQDRQAGYFDLLLIGIAPDGRQVRVSVKGDEDPGYGSTPRMIAESAICLVTEADAVPGGFWTPAAALQGRLVERLQRYAGLTFAVEG